MIKTVKNALRINMYAAKRMNSTKNIFFRKSNFPPINSSHHANL
ncbi:hypothetical protein [Tenacibaculum bernardetii]|nr:hypothetical protein [Tenacibaculum bernardetii]